MKYKKLKDDGGVIIQCTLDDGTTARSPVMPDTSAGIAEGRELAWNMADVAQRERDEPERIRRKKLEMQERHREVRRPRDADAE